MMRPCQSGSMRVYTALSLPSQGKHPRLPIQVLLWLRGSWRWLYRGRVKRRCDFCILGHVQAKNSHSDAPYTSRRVMMVLRASRARWTVAVWRGIDRYGHKEVQDGMQMILWVIEAAKVFGAKI